MRTSKELEELCEFQTDWDRFFTMFGTPLPTNEEREQYDRGLKKNEFYSYEIHGFTFLETKGGDILFIITGHETTHIYQVDLENRVATKLDGYYTR